MAKVLVVEDNGDNLRLISKVLERGGYTVGAAVNGTDGVNLAMKEKFSFIVMDINLPDMDGLEAAKRIRETGIDKDVPIIAITSYAMRGDMARILAAGCSGYFEKPIDPLKILAEIHRIIGVEK
ncbi:MAG TPA: response regulator [Elusimicrobia bacterium]|nr:response regulator [Elusimicrobiota bacterium]